MYIHIIGTFRSFVDMALNKEKLQFLIANSDFFLRFISYCYPFRLDTIDRFHLLLDWTELSVNQRINWNMDYVTKYEHLLNFGIYRCGNQTGWLGYNESLPWCEEFIEKYYEKWEWSILANNKSIIDNPKLRNTYYDELLPFLGQLEEKEQHEAFLRQDFIEYMQNEIEYINNNPELQFSTIDEIEKHENIDWLELSTNEYLPWSIDLIEKYADKWDWQLLSLNEELPWSKALLDRFKDKWVWGEYRNSTAETSFILGLSSNTAVPWDAQIIERFKDKISWELLSSNSGVKWDFDLLMHFHPSWDFTELALNEAFWYQIFPELIDRDIVFGLLQMLEQHILHQHIQYQFTSEN